MHDRFNQFLEFFCNLIVVNGCSHIHFSFQWCVSKECTCLWICYPLECLPVLSHIPFCMDPQHFSLSLENKQEHPCIITVNHLGFYLLARLPERKCGYRIAFLKINEWLCHTVDEYWYSCFLKIALKERQSTVGKYFCIWSFSKANSNILQW